MLLLTAKKLKIRSVSAIFSVFCSTFASKYKRMLLTVRLEEPREAPKGE